MSISRLIWIVVLVAVALLVLPLYLRFWNYVTGSCGLIEFLMPRVV